MKYLATAFFAFIFLGVYLPVGSSWAKHSGKAVDIKTGAFAYLETHEDAVVKEKPVEGRTIYSDASGKPFAERTLHYKDDPVRPDYLLKDSRSGYSEGATNLGNGKIKVFYKDNFKAPVREKVIAVEEPYVIDAGFNHFVRKYWNALMKGEVVKFNFIAPAKLDFYRFRVSNTGIVTIGGRKGMKVKLEVNNIIARAVVDPLFITYALDDKGLLAYEGVSNVVSENGKNFTVIANYTGTGR